MLEMHQFLEKIIQNHQVFDLPTYIFRHKNPRSY